MRALSYQWARVRAFGKRQGPSPVKAWIWDWEFRHGKWDHLDEGQSESTVIRLVRKYLNGGRLLDLACGTGVMRAELRAHDDLGSYVGVDISPTAIDIARQRSRRLPALARPDEFIVGGMGDRRVLDALGSDFDVVLLKECINYLRVDEVSTVLASLAPHLNDTGRFIIQVHDRHRWAAHVAAARSLLSIEEDVPATTHPGLTLVGRFAPTVST